jgi:RNA polymerase-binding protein DksA
MAIGDGFRIPLWLWSSVNMSSPDTAVRFRGCSPYPPEELEQFRLLLLQRRNELGHSYQGLTDAACRTPGDASGQLSNLPSQAGELAAETYEQELSIEMMGRLHGELTDIQEALDRIESRSYGVCEDCGEQIPAVRLEAAPMARFCIGCQSRIEN